MTGLAKALCMLAFIAVAVMHPAGHSYCTTTNSFCSVVESECCSHAGSSCCEDHSESQTEDPCCVEIDGDWQHTPGSSLVQLPEPMLLELFLWDTVDGLKLSKLMVSPSWQSGGFDVRW